MKTIIVRFIKEGFHYWPEAPEEVAFLRNNHRHEFQWEVEIEVDHNDRELEYFMVKKWATFVAPEGEMGSMSCEMMAEKMIRLLKSKYGKTRMYSVTVSEDGENGSRVTT